MHRQPPLTALLLSMVASMGDHQGHSALPTAGARCECLKWMRVGDGLCPNSFRATGDNSTAYAGSFGDYNTATAAGDNSVLTQAAAGVTGDNNYGNTATNSGDGTGPLPSLASSAKATMTTPPPPPTRAPSVVAAGSWPPPALSDRQRRSGVRPVALSRVHDGFDHSFSVAPRLISCLATASESDGGGDSLGRMLLEIAKGMRWAWLGRAHTSGSQ